MKERFNAYRINIKYAIYIRISVFKYNDSRMYSDTCRYLLWIYILLCYAKHLETLALKWDY